MNVLNQAVALCVSHKPVRIDSSQSPILSILFQHTGYQGQQGSSKLLYSHIIEFWTSVGSQWDQTLLIVSPPAPNIVWAPIRIMQVKQTNMNSNNPVVQSGGWGGGWTLHVDNGMFTAAAH